MFFTETPMGFLSLVFVILWVATINAAFILPKKAFITRFFYKEDSRSFRAVTWLLHSIAMLVIGGWFDALTVDRPHIAYQNWQFYATFFILSAVFAAPGFLVDRALRRGGKRP